MDFGLSSCQRMYSCRWPDWSTGHCRSPRPIQLPGSRERNWRISSRPTTHGVSPPLSWVRKEDWNTCRIVATGPSIRHYVNGVLMSEVEDFDPDKRRLSGLLGVQVHVGPPMKIKYRRIELTHLADETEPGLLRFLERLHPTFKGGEYLPDHLPGEVKIACIALKSAAGIIIDAPQAPQPRHRPSGALPPNPRSLPENGRCCTLDLEGAWPRGPTWCRS